MDSLQKLIELERKLTENLQRYVETEEKELENYRKFLDRIQNEHALVSEDVENYVGNPVKAFMLIKRMVVDWNYLRSTSNHIKAHEEFITAFNKSIRDVPLPNKDDLIGASNGFERLEEMYDLTEHPLIDEISWRESFEVAYAFFNDDKWVLAIKWFEVTLTKLNADFPDGSSEDYKRFIILCSESIASSYFRMDNIDMAVKYLKDIVNIDPTHRDNKFLHKISAKDLQFERKYKSLCRGEQDPDARLHKLKCKFETKGRPYFALAPLKTEELSLDPEINLYHDVLQDSQIEKILNESWQKKMVKSRVKGTTEPFKFDDNTRLSKQTWLPYTSPTLKEIRILLEEITGLNMYNSEYMQVANYGIGGHYILHYDFHGIALPSYWDGDRMTTQIFYLSDVELGGYTIFPFLNVYIRPIKGSMVMWKNLHRSLDCDFRLLHGACPVLKGSKRIAISWIHSGYQEFRHPCGLQNDYHKSEMVRYIKTL